MCRALFFLYTIYHRRELIYSYNDIILSHRPRPICISYLFIVSNIHLPTTAVHTDKRDNARRACKIYRCIPIRSSRDNYISRNLVVPDGCVCVRMLCVIISYTVRQKRPIYRYLLNNTYLGVYPYI